MLIATQRNGRITTNYDRTDASRHGCTVVMGNGNHKGLLFFGVSISRRLHRFLPELAAKATAQRGTVLMQFRVQTLVCVPSHHGKLELYSKPRRSTGDRRRYACTTAVALHQREALLVRFSRDLHVFEEMRQLFEFKGLWPINQRLSGRRMKVYKNHVGAGDNSLRRRMHYIKYPLRSSRSVPDRMGRIDANWHARQ